MLDYYTVSSKYNQFQNGPAKSEAIKKAIDNADLEKNYECSLRFRYDYIYQAVFYDDIFKAFIMFPQYLEIYDKYYDKIHYKTKYVDMISAYIWIIDNSSDFYQISNEEIMKYLKDLKKRIIEGGYSIKAYYLRLSRFLDGIDEIKYKEVFNQYLNAPKGRFNSNEIEEKFNRIYFEMFHGSFKKAMKLAQPILNGKIRFGNYLECLYNNIIFYYIDKNILKENIKDVSKYKDLLYKEMSKSISSLSFLNTIIMYCVILDLDSGLALFKKHLDWYLKIRTPKVKFDFEVTLYRLFMAIKEKENKKTIKLNLNSNFELYRDSCIYSVDELINYFKNDIIYIAEKFDEHNKNNNYIKRVMDNNFLN